MNREKKKFLFRLLVLAAGILILECLIGNYSSVRSLFYEKTDLTAQMVTEGDLIPIENYGTAEEHGRTSGYHSDSGNFSLRFENLDLDVKNLHLGLKLPEGAYLPYKVWLTDEGNHYSYELPQQMLAEGIPAGFYPNLYPYGKVHSIAVEFLINAPVQFEVEEIAVNVSRPFFLNGIRMMILFAVGLLGIGFREKSRLWEIPFEAHSKWQNVVTLLVILSFLILGWELSHANSACVESRWPHQQQYKELAVALTEGRVWLEEEPSAELLAAPNPYDTIYLQANQIHYMADYVLHEGKYYVYFGIVPELLLFLPYYKITGEDLGNHLAVFALYAGFVLAVFGMYREAVKRWFPNSAFCMYLLVCALTLTFGNFMFLIARPDLYNIPDMGANLFTAAGIGLWLAGLNRGDAQDRYRWPFFALGSLCMALVAGCRPQMLLFSVLCFPLFAGELRELWELCRMRRRIRAFHKKAAWNVTACGEHGQSESSKPDLDGRFLRLFRDALAVTLPYLVVAAGIMYYNFLRFGSPFDFGATYSLTSNDMTHRGFNLSRVLYGIYCFFFQPSRYEGVFPFLMRSEILTDYMGRMVSEFTFGGILASHTITWCLLFAWQKRFGLKKKKIWTVMALSAAMAVIIGGFDANGAGILQRYTADMTFGIAFATGLLLLALFERAEGKFSLLDSGEEGSAGSAASGRGALILLRAAVLQHALYAFLIVFAVGDSVNLFNYGKELFYRAAELFRW